MAIRPVTTCIALVGRVSLALGVCCTSVPITAHAGDASQPALRVAVDPRVELLSIVFRLAGNPEYSQGRVASYNRDVDEWFRPFRDHRAIELARKLRDTRSVSYDACMSMAVHLTDASTIREKTPFDPRPRGLDARWPVEGTRDFLAALREFVKETKFEEFVGKHQSLYRTAESRLETLMREHGHLEWFDEFFGKRPGGGFTLVPALVNGPCNYGVRFGTHSGSEEIFAILGVWSTDSEGLPQFNPGMLGTVIHEFGHSYTNAIIDAHADELRAAGEKLFPPVKSLMGRQGYGHWKTMLYESLLRACVVRYTERYEGKEAAERQIRYEQRRGFAWTVGLASLLSDYESHRKEYPSLDAFAPRIAAFFNEYAARQPEAAPRTWTDRILDFLTGPTEEPAASDEKTSRASVPRVVSTTPANGATDVDPELKIITVVFDRPMAPGSWALVRINEHFPETSGDPRYDATHTRWTVPVKLRPGYHYEVMLNAEQFQGFRSREGTPLEPVKLSFATRK